MQCYQIGNSMAESFIASCGMQTGGEKCVRSGEARGHSCVGAICLQSRSKWAKGASLTEPDTSPYPNSKLDSWHEVQTGESEGNRITSVGRRFVANTNLNRRVTWANWVISNWKLVVVGRQAILFSNMLVNDKNKFCVIKIKFANFPALPVVAWNSPDLTNFGLGAYRRRSNSNSFANN